MNTSTETKNSDSNKGSKATLECNICYEEATEPVATHCGHIYCWPCIYKWIDAKKEQATCPVCTNVISKDKIVSLFARGETGKKKHTEDIPKRPQPEREERKENTGNQQNANARFGAFHGFGLFNGLLGGFHFNFGNMGVSFGFPQLIPMLIFFLFNFIGGSFYDSDVDSYQTTNSRRSGTSSNQNQRRQGPTNNFQSQNYSQENSFVSGSGMTLVIMFCVVLFFAMPYIIRRFNRR